MSTSITTAQVQPATTPKMEMSPDRLMHLGLGFWASKALLSSVELGVFTTLARGPMEIEPLRERLGLHPRGARDFMDALVALGLLERQGTAYTNSPESDYFLDRGKPLREVSLHLLNRAYPQNQGFPPYVVFTCFLQPWPRYAGCFPFGRQSRPLASATFKFTRAPEALVFWLDQCVRTPPLVRTS